MKHLDLFAGIGGFSLAARWMQWETIAWVEIDPFCQKVLKKNFPNAKGYNDIYEFDSSEYTGAIDIITGGFPCQPFSIAGKRRGKDDSRFLWTEMFRVISENQPRFVVAENVTGILSISGGLVFESVCTDLESQGYAVQAFIIPAEAVGLPHRRERVWIAATKNANSSRLQKRENEAQPEMGQFRNVDARNGDGIYQPNNCNTNKERQLQPQGLFSEIGQRIGDEIKQSWYEVAQQLCRVDDGVSRRLDSNRLSRIAALGNAIVPQIAVRLFKAISNL